MGVFQKLCTDELTLENSLCVELRHGCIHNTKEHVQLFRRLHIDTGALRSFCCVQPTLSDRFAGVGALSKACNCEGQTQTLLWKLLALTVDSALRVDGARRRTSAALEVFLLMFV